MAQPAVNEAAVTLDQLLHNDNIASLSSTALVDGVSHQARLGFLTTYAFGSSIFTALMINDAPRKCFIVNG